jgi:pimeloyl-ACP methyl ester carboxylesterase
MTDAHHLLFLPGASGSPDIWRPMGELLPDGWKKTYMSWPGVGEQPRDPNVRSFDDLVSLVERHLRDEPCDVLAHSMGGPIALSAVLRNPGRVRRLVLAVTSGGLPALREFMHDWRPDHRAKYPNAAMWLADHDRDLTPHLPRFRVPTLLLWGDQDPISPLLIAERLRVMLPDATLHVVPGGGHDIVRTHASELVTRVAEHLR